MPILILFASIFLASLPDVFIVANRLIFFGIIRKIEISSNNRNICFLIHSYYLLYLHLPGFLIVQTFQMNAIYKHFLDVKLIIWFVICEKFKCRDKIAACHHGGLEIFFIESTWISRYDECIVPLHLL